MTLGLSIVVTAVLNIAVIPMQVLHTWIGVLDVYSFDLSNSLKKASRCRNMQQTDTCDRFHSTECNLLVGV